MAATTKRIVNRRRATPERMLTQLREAGYRVVVAHKRPFHLPDGSVRLLQRHEAPEGATLLQGFGASECWIYRDGTEAGDVLLGIGTAKTSRVDGFNRKRGSTIAIGRAVKAAGL